jgi:hypothetical protein
VGGRPVGTPASAFDYLTAVAVPGGSDHALSWELGLQVPVPRKLLASAALVLAAASAFVGCGGGSSSRESSSHYPLTYDQGQDRLAADGTHVAVVDENDDIRVWDAATNKAFSTFIDSGDNSACNYSELVVAWPELAAVCISLSTSTWYDLDVRDYPRAWRGLDERQPGNGGTIGPLRGDRSLLVFNSYDIGQTRPLKLWLIPPKAGTGTIGESQPIGIATGVELADAARGRIAGWQRGDAVILDRHGRILRRFRGLRENRTKLFLDQPWLLAVTSARITAYNLKSGRTAFERTLVSNATVENAEAELVVYLAQDKVHVLRLTDGRQGTLQTAQRPLRARLTSAGLFYAYADGVAFIQMQAVRAAL